MVPGYRLPRHSGFVFSRDYGEVDDDGTSLALTVLDIKQVAIMLAQLCQQRNGAVFVDETHRFARQQRIQRTEDCRMAERLPMPRASKGWICWSSAGSVKTLDITTSNLGGSTQCRVRPMKPKARNQNGSVSLLQQQVLRGSTQ